MLGALGLDIAPRAWFWQSKLTVWELWRASGRPGARYCSQGMVLAVKIDGLGALAGFWTPWGSILLPGPVRQILIYWVPTPHNSVRQKYIYWAPTPKMLVPNICILKIHILGPNSCKTLEFGTQYTYSFKIKLYVYWVPKLMNGSLFT